MLIYTRLAAPKEPKRRSRGGCSFCKEKKKKCDENRPKCSRCDEHGVECTYAAVKPRQRRRRDPLRLGLLTAGTPSEQYSTPRRLSEVSYFSNDCDYFRWRDDDHGRAASKGVDDAAIFSPLSPTFAGFPMLDFAPNDLAAGYPENDDSGVFTDAPHEEPVIDENDNPSNNAIVSRPRSPSPDMALISPLLGGPTLLEFTAPVYSEFSERPNRRALIDHFCNVLSHRIVFREETGNPFQQLILPLTRKSPPVMNAIFALASAHLEYRGVENPEKSLYFHNRAIQGVGQLIQQNDKVNRNEILAAIMLLVYYECLVQKGHSNIVAGHLKGFLTIMCTTVPEPLDPTGIFLERAFRFYDVITALSNGTSPLSSPPSASHLLPLSPLGAPTTSPLSNVDTLLGMSTTLWPIIHRLSTLLPLKSELDQSSSSSQSSSSCSSSSKMAVLRTEFSSTAQAIERALNDWEPSSTPASNSNIQSIYHNALSYRHASLLYLYRTVLGHTRLHPLVQKHMRITLEHCDATVKHKGPMSALLWPLFVASVEAVEKEDRELAEKVFGEVERRQGMTNIGEAWEVVRGVWGRDDETRPKGAELGGETEGETVKKGEEIWRVVGREMGVSIVFG